VGSILFSDEDRIYIAAQLRRARLRAGFNQEQLAELLGKPQSFVAKCETRERKIEFFELLEFCSVLAITVEELVRPEIRPLLTTARKEKS